MENTLSRAKLEPMLIVLGRIIKERRQSLGLSQCELALRSGLHRTYVSDIEKGHRNLTIGATVLLAGGLGVQLRDLISTLEPND